MSYNNIVNKIKSILYTSPVPTDLFHAKCVLKWIMILNPEAGEDLKIAALGHDIDRSIPSVKPNRQSFKKYEDYKKAHSIASANIIDTLLIEFNYNYKFRSSVRKLIENHETGGKEDLQILTDADAISFFEPRLIDFYLNSEIYKEHSRDKIKYSYSRASPYARKIILNLFPKDRKYSKMIKECIDEFG